METAEANTMEEFKVTALTYSSPQVNPVLQRESSWECSDWNCYCMDKQRIQSIFKIGCCVD